MGAALGASSAGSSTFTADPTEIRNPAWAGSASTTVPAASKTLAGLISWIFISCRFLQHSEVPKLGYAVRSVLPSKKFNNVFLLAGEIVVLHFDIFTLRIVDANALEITNNSRGNLQATYLFFNGYGDGYALKKTFGADDELSVELKSGESATGKLFYYVPEETKVFEVEYKPSLLTGDIVVFDCTDDPASDTAA